VGGRLSCPYLRDIGNAHAIGFWHTVRGFHCRSSPSTADSFADGNLDGCSLVVVDLT
jgi:hypothetical protein